MKHWRYIAIVPLFCLFVPVSLHLKGNSSAAASTSCSDTMLSSATSPNKAWDAIAATDYCQGSSGFDTLLTSYVIIQSRTKPGQYYTVFDIDDGGKAQFHPAVQWLSSTKLQITVAKSPLIGTQETSYSGITIVYKYR